MKNEMEEEIVYSSIERYELKQVEICNFWKEVLHPYKSSIDKIID